MATKTAAQYQAELEQLKKTQSQAGNIYNQYVAGGAGVGLQAQKAVNQKLSTGLTQTIEGLKEERKLTPTAYAAEMREGRFAGDPILAAQAAAQREANIQRRLGEATYAREQQEGTAQQIAGAITSGYEAQTQQAKIAMDRASQEFNQTFSLAQFAAQEEERKRQAEALTYINAGNHTLGLDSQGNVVKKFAHSQAPARPAAQAAPKATTFNKQQIDEAIKIINNPMLSANPSEREGKGNKPPEGDKILSKEEQFEAWNSLQQAGYDPLDAYALMQRAWVSGNFQTWEDHNKYSNEMTSSKLIEDEIKKRLGIL